MPSDEPTHMQWPLIRNEPETHDSVPSTSYTPSNLHTTPRRLKRPKQVMIYRKIKTTHHSNVQVLPVSPDFAATLRPGEREALKLTAQIASTKGVAVRVMPEQLQRHVLLVEIGCHLWCVSHLLICSHHR